MSEAPIHIVPYDPTWVAKFETEKALLETLLAPWRRGPIEHVGSTAVAGLCAKPVIDVMVGVSTLAESEPAKDALCRAGYQYAEYKTDVMHWFCKPSFAMRTHHLHLIPYGSPLWHDRLKFRDLHLLDEPFEIPPNSPLMVTVLSATEAVVGEDWISAARKAISGAYGANEPEYGTADLRHP